MNTLNLSKYEVTKKQMVRNSETQQIETKDVTEVIDPKQLLYELMRAPGIFKNGTEIVEAVIIARTIRDANDELEIDEKDLSIVKKVLDHFIAKDHNPAVGQVALGGPEYEELIMRVYK